VHIFRELLSYATFKSTMNATAKAAGHGFRNVITMFPGNKKDPNYTSIVNKWPDALKDLCCNMSLKIHSLNSPLNDLVENLGSLSEKQGKRFHQDVKEIERCQGRWNINMLAD
jgi:hypothetical protein